MAAALLETVVLEYVGDRDDAGHFHGAGKAVFTSGQTYEGGWQHGRMAGMGTICFPDGVNYQGTMVDDSISGKGVYQWGNVVYTGEILNGKRHGYGILQFTDSPVVYEGQWQDGQRHGKGVLYYNAHRTAYYHGDWEHDMKQGAGTSMYHSGNSYCGSWAQDMREGQGTMTWATLGQAYSGDWANNLPNGLGEHVWQTAVPAMHAGNHAMHFMHNRYFGQFKDGKRHGEGSLWYSSGARYEGEWEHDRKQGHGVYGFEDGSVFAGQFAADRPVMDSGSFTGAADTLRTNPAPVSTVPAATGGNGGSIPSTSGRHPVKGMSTSSANVGIDLPQPAQQTSASGAAAAAPSAVADTAAGGNVASTGTAAGGSPIAGPPGFGPRVSILQLYIADLLQEYDAPAATYKTISNLLVGYNTELRALYDKYCACHSPELDPAEPRNSWAMQAGQVWELLRDGQLLCRHVQLHQACELIQKALAPPPPVAQRREQVLTTPAAAAVQRPPQHPYDPATELLFRDFCELLVRLAALRYPQLGSLEQKVQQVLTQHLLPLLMRPARLSTGTARQTLDGAVQSPVANAMADHHAGHADELQGREAVTKYLQSQAVLLRQLFAAFAAAMPGITPDTWQGRLTACLLAGGSAAQSGLFLTTPRAANTSSGKADGYEDCWRDETVTARQVVAVLRQAGVLQRWQLSAAAVAEALLQGVLRVIDPEGLRARMEGFVLEPDEKQHGSSQEASGSAALQTLLYWMDAQLLHVEVLWGLVHCTTLVPVAAAEQQQAMAEQQTSGDGHAEAGALLQPAEADLLARIAGLFGGKGGLFELVLGIQPEEPVDVQQVVAGGAAEIQHDPIGDDEGPHNADDAASSLADGASWPQTATTVTSSRPQTALGSRPETATTNSRPQTATSPPAVAHSPRQLVDTSGTGGLQGLQVESTHA